MINSKANPVESPDVVLVVGSGRWARVFLGVLCEIVSPKVKIIALTHNNKILLTDWLLRKGLHDRVDVVTELPVFASPGKVAGIVVNAARDHESSAERLLVSGVSVLVEKPICLTYSAVAKLEALALKGGVKLAGAYVFLYARYIDNFINIISTAGKVLRAYVYWEDPSAESRYGEQKSFDPGLPIVADWLPHVLPILEKISASPPGECKKLQLLRGGGHVELEIMFGEVYCNVKMVRNSNYRRRVIVVETEVDSFELDFSREPGVIRARGSEICGDQTWGQEPGPVTQMLKAFLGCVAGNDVDVRLDAKIGMRANNVIDQALGMYGSALVSWMRTRLMPPVEIDADLRYAFCESLQYKRLLNKIELDDCIDKIISGFSGDNSAYWIELLSKAHAPLETFDQLIANGAKSKRC